MKIKEVESLSSSKRGTHGFGSTGMRPLDPELPTSSSGSSEKTAVRSLRTEVSTDRLDGRDDRLKDFAWMGYWEGETLEGGGPVVAKMLAQVESNVGPILPKNVVQEISSLPNPRGRNQWECLEKGYPGVVCYAHKKPRWKFFDVEAHKTAGDPWSKRSVTIMWLSRGGIRVVLNRRLGTAHIEYSDDSWMGYTLFFSRPNGG